jgi:DeoR/GlpR family transcriptional regulator of sugar metabolism
MRVPLVVVEARRRELAYVIQQQGYVPLKELCRRFGISEATARRDLDALERAKKITRTYGGALVDYNNKFPSFRQRLENGAAAKRRVAALAVERIEPGMVCYLDAGTTIYYLAQRLREFPVRPLTVVTPSLPVAEILAGLEGIEVHLTGGQLLERQSVLLGEMTAKMLGLWKFDIAFISVEAFDRDGLWNTRPEVVAMQRVAVERALKTAVCADGRKLGKQSAAFLFDWRPVSVLISDARPEQLKRAGVSA